MVSVVWAKRSHLLPPSLPRGGAMVHCLTDNALLTVRKPPQPPLFPHAVWINPPKDKTASQNRAGATILITDDPRVARNVEGIGVGAEPVVGSPYAITTPTDEVLH